MRRLALIAVFSLCASTGLFAQTLTVSTSGTYTASVPTSSWTAPSTPWTLSFNIARNPTVNSYVIGANFNAPVTNVAYTLNGNPVTVTPVSVTFYSASAGGLVLVQFASGGFAFNVYGGQAYANLESSPTILPGVYLETANNVIVGSTNYPIPTGTVTITATAGGPVTTPVPSSLLLMLVGLTLGTAYFTFRRFARV